MEISRTGKFKVPYFGGLPYLSGDKIVRLWLKAQGNKLLHPRYKELVAAIDNEEALEKMLKVFNVDEHGYPVIPTHQLFECSRNAARLAGIWYKYKVSNEGWSTSILLEPINCSLTNGKLIKAPDGVDVRTVTTKVNRKTVSFFTAYQYINAGATFDMKLSFPEDLVTKVTKVKNADTIYEPDPEKSQECANMVLDKMGSVGLGAFRSRYGKFAWV